MTESPDLFPYAKQALLRPSLDLGRDEQVQERPVSQTRGSDAIQPFAHDPRLGVGLNGLSSARQTDIRAYNEPPSHEETHQTSRGSTPRTFTTDSRLRGGLNGLNSAHLAALLEQLPPKPTYSHRAKTDEGYMPVQSSSQAVAEDKGLSAAVVVYASTGEGDADADDDDGFEAEDAIPPENTDNVNPEKLALLEERSPYAKKGTKGWMSARLASEAACLASLVHLTRPCDAFRPVQKYKALKAIPNLLTPDQFRKIWQLRQQNPHASKAPLRGLELVVPKPEFQTKLGSNLKARSDATSKAAAKNTLQPISVHQKTVKAFKAYMEQRNAHAPASKQTVDTCWHFSCEDSKKIMKSNYPAPGF